VVCPPARWPSSKADASLPRCAGTRSGAAGGVVTMRRGQQRGRWACYQLAGARRAPRWLPFPLVAITVVITLLSLLGGMLRSGGCRAQLLEMLTTSLALLPRSVTYLLVAGVSRVPVAGVSRGPCCCWGQSRTAVKLGSRPTLLLLAAETWAVAGNRRGGCRRRRYAGCCGIAYGLHQRARRAA
jgi:hypothetical protein